MLKKTINGKLGIPVLVLEGDFTIAGTIVPSS
jgi:hypothetical protein